MFKIKSISIILAIFFAGISHAQIEGANLFSTNQVVSIDLDFPQSDFWQQLQDNYENIDSCRIRLYSSPTNID